MSVAGHTTGFQKSVDIIEYWRIPTEAAQYVRSQAMDWVVEHGSDVSLQVEDRFLLI